MAQESYACIVIELSYNVVKDASKEEIPILIPCGPATPPDKYTVPVAPVPPINVVGCIWIEDKGAVLNCIDPVAPVPYCEAYNILFLYCDTGKVRIPKLAQESYGCIVIEVSYNVAKDASKEEIPILIPCGPATPPDKYTVPVAPVPPINVVGCIWTEDNGGVYM